MQENAPRMQQSMQANSSDVRAENARIEAISISTEEGQAAANRYM